MIERLFQIALASRLRMEVLAAQRGMPSNLHRLCAVAAFDLFRALRAEHIPALFVVGQRHCFCLVGDLVVDTTATQFHKVDPIQGVWIADTTEPDFIADPGVWQQSATFGSEDDVLAADLWDVWPHPQRPHALDDDAMH